VALLGLAAVLMPNLRMADTESVHRHNPVFAVAATIFIVMAAGLLIMELLALLSARADRARRYGNEPPRSGYLGLASAVLTGPSMKVLRRRALTVLAVSGVVALAAFLA
jgi:hypothetical protein